MARSDSIAVSCSFVLTVGMALHADASPTRRQSWWMAKRLTTSMFAPVTPSQAEPVLQNPGPTGHPVIAVPRAGVLFEGGVEDLVDIRCHDDAARPSGAVERERVSSVSELLAALSEDLDSHLVGTIAAR